MGIGLATPPHPSRTRIPCHSRRSPGLPLQQQLRAAAVRGGGALGFLPLRLHPAVRLAPLSLARTLLVALPLLRLLPPVALPPLRRLEQRSLRGCGGIGGA